MELEFRLIASFWEEGKTREKMKKSVLEQGREPIMKATHINPPQKT